MNLRLSSKIKRKRGGSRKNEVENDELRGRWARVGALSGVAFSERSLAFSLQGNTAITSCLRRSPSPFK